MRKHFLLAIFVCLIAITSIQAQLEDLAPGLVAEVNNVQFVHARPAFDETSMPLDPRLGAASIAGVWKGLVQIKGVHKTTLHAHVQGKITITIAGNKVLAGETKSIGWVSGSPHELPPGLQEIEILYEQVGNEPRLALFWSSDSFPREPMGQNNFFHEIEDTPAGDFSSGSDLVRTGRCAACHDLPGEAAAMPAPAIDQLAGQINRQWLTEFLVADHSPGFGLTNREAQLMTDYLLSGDEPKPAKLKKPGAKEKAPDGEELFSTIGCYACHKLGDVGADGAFAGGDLSEIAVKRPPSFFEQWLSDPANMNRNHRMPVFELTAAERVSLARFLQQQGKHVSAPLPKSTIASLKAGRELLITKNCQACHELPGGKKTPAAKRFPLPQKLNWEASCLNANKTREQPKYSFDPKEKQAVQTYISQMREHAPTRVARTGAQLLRERNCVACHARETFAGFKPTVLKISKKNERLAPLVPAMTPPSLASVGDKLTREALLAAIVRKEKPHRPYLNVRMPRFRIEKNELNQIADHLIAHDRVPAYERETPPPVEASAQFIAGSRLVTSDGFGCTSCHQVGSVLPAKAPLNARGPDLSMLGQRIRKPWYDRWMKNPARIVPGMEMPSVQIAVKGVLKDDVHRQLNAVWHTLNVKSFEPPEPNPVRVVRRSGNSLPSERAAVLTDVLHNGDDIYIKPLLIGLPNRHNILFDLESASLKAWRIGNVARQRARGKKWNWETAGTQLWRRTGEEFALSSPQDVFKLVHSGQFATEFDQIEHFNGGVKFTHRLLFQGSDSKTRQMLVLQQTYTSLKNQTGFDRQISVAGLLPEQLLSISLPGFKAELKNERKFRFDQQQIEVLAGEFETSKQTSALELHIPATSESKTSNLTLRYSTSATVDQFFAPETNLPQPESARLSAAPGFETTRLPLADEFMPTGLAWRKDGSMIVTSLKGRVWSLRDTDGDTLVDKATVFSDELAAPYGAFVGDGYVDVITKYALLRLFDDNNDDVADRMQTIASGWGHTADYHDWVVGLPRDEKGNYYLSIPCEQDGRSNAAAVMRGKVLRVAPREPTRNDPRLYKLETISGGHRFPMGIARTKAGDIFVTDNQGNYNPYNELNHVVPGARFGFINSTEKKDKNFKPPLTSPAINIPHPWTRSVNGICVLEPPSGVAADHFGPFRGNLIGCEYDTRRLVRMSLQKVNGKWQGAAYPFSDPNAKGEDSLLGPICCAVSPGGDLYIGELRDSGWGGSNNIGAITRLRPDFKNLPTGIAKVEYREGKFEIFFTRAIDPTKAKEDANYTISSATRTSTPAYGGSDEKRRAEKIKSVRVAGDSMSVAIELSDDLRTGFVYDFQLKNLAVKDARFFPAEAYYSLNEK